MAKKTLHYKGYQGSIDVNTIDFTLSGKILFINEDYPYSGDSFEELEQNYQKAVEDHIKSCNEAGVEPPFSE